MHTHTIESKRTRKQPKIRFITAAFPCLFLLAHFISANAQSRAELTLTGRITDNRGDAAYGASVVLTTSAGSVARTAKTGRDGRFTISAPPGSYELRVTATGF